MCGRFCCSLNPTLLETKLKGTGLDVNNKWIDIEKYNPRYNCSPRSYIPVIRKSDKDNTTLQSMVWGFVPYFAQKMPDTQPINARDDTLVDGSAVFDRSKNQRRCIVVAEGFYEWKKLSNGKKIPYYTKRKDGQLMLFASIYDESHPIDWKEPTLYSTAIITTSSSSFFSFLHNRMPVILEIDQVDKWLNHSSTWSNDLIKLMKPFEGELDCYQVTDKVGLTSNESSDFIIPVDSLKSSISNFFGKQNKTQPSSTLTVSTPQSSSSRSVKEMNQPKLESQKSKPPLIGIKRSSSSNNNNSAKSGIKKLKKEEESNRIDSFFFKKG